MAPQKETISELKDKYLQLQRKYGFICLTVSLIVSGFFLLYFVHLHWLGEQWREFAMAMLVAGTVGTGVEYMVHKRLESILKQVTGDALEPHFLRVTERLEKNEAAMQMQVLPRLDEFTDLLRNNNLRAFGVKQIYADRWHSDLLRYLAEAEGGSKIHLLAICLTGLALQPAKTVMRDRLKNRCTIRILLIDPDSDFVRIRALEEDSTTTESDIEEFREEVRRCNHSYAQFMRHLPADLRARLEIRHYDAAPTHFLLNNEKAMLVGFYLRERRGDTCPHLEFEIKPNGAYEAFQAHFEALWNKAIPVDRREADQPCSEERRLRLVPS